MVQNRNKTLDIAKAICICLMVIGHSGCPEYLNRFIYMFHMPCFFFISGWLLKDKYLVELKKGLFNKIKGSYFPFVKWSFIFLIFHNVFATLHFYEDEYSLWDFFVKSIRILTMTGSEQLLGGYWFLISLCWASVISLLFLYILQKIKYLNSVSVLAGIIIFILISALEHSLPFNLPQQLSEQTLLAIAFYLSGYLYHKIGSSYQIPLVIGLAFLLIPALVAIYVKWGMSVCKGLDVFPYYFVALIGSLGVISISKWLSDQRVTPIFTYIGDKTLYILTFHFFVFKLVSWIYICIEDLPIDSLVRFPVLQDTNPYMWVIYSLIGVGSSLLIWEIFHLEISLSKFLRNSK